VCAGGAGGVLTAAVGGEEIAELHAAVAAAVKAGTLNPEP